MITEQYIKLGRLTALISFLLGAIIFGLYFLTSSLNFLFLGYGFIVLTGLLNMGILIFILVKARNDKDNRKKLLTTWGLMLLNIPVVFFYFWVAFILVNSMRITFTNYTQSALTNINIVGCAGGHIEKLKVGQSQTVWIDISDDCSININYLLNGQQKEEMVVGYAIRLMGQKIKHNIGGQNEKQF